MMPAAKLGQAILPWPLAVAAAIMLGAPDGLFRVPLAELSAARQARDERVALAATPPIRVPTVALPSESFSGRDANAAAAALQTAIRSAAARAGVLIERLDPVMPAGSDSPLRLHLRASGTEKAVLGLTADLQGMTPVLAFPTWSLSAVGDATGALRLEAQVASPWYEVLR